VNSARLLLVTWRPGLPVVRCRESAGLEVLQEMRYRARKPCIDQRSAIRTRSDSGKQRARVRKHRGERKTLTALFADIKGSMELIEDLDPEEARAMVDPALKLMMDAAHRYGGYVAPSHGGGIFALFWGPGAHPDHPPRRLLSALPVQGEHPAYST